MATSLTKRAIDELEFTPGCDYFVWDRDLKGFGIRVTEHLDRAGNILRRKTFVVSYRPKGSRQSRRINIGTYGVLTPQQAREEGKQKLAAIVQGVDPIQEKRASGGGPTVQTFGKEWLEEVTAKRKEGTAKEYKRLWEKHVLPALGPKPLAAVSSADIERLHRSLHKQKYVANRVVARLKTFFAYAIRKGAIPSKENPAHDVETYKERARERFLTKDEFGRLGEALTKAERQGLLPPPELQSKPKSEKTAKHRPKSADVPVPANPYAVAAIRLLALTGCREGEILSLRWDAVDFERGCLRLEDTKTGRSVRPLGQSAIALLESLPQVPRNPYVLPGLKRGTHLKEIKRVWYAVRHEAKLKGLRLHDLRHSFASVPASSGESLLIVKSLLGHKHISATERYAHLGDDPVKRAADKTANEIASWLKLKRRDNDAASAA